MEIIDNFLTNQEHKIIHDTMLSANFPWFINNILDENSDDIDNKELTHIFYNNYSFNSNFVNIITPIVQKINPKSLIRIRAALMPYLPEQKENGWHTDFNFPCTTAIYYVNSNNGYTKFEEGTIVESVANRFVFFDSEKVHLGTHSTNTQFRCLINFNYF